MVSPSLGTKERVSSAPLPNTGEAMETVAPSMPSLSNDCHEHQIWPLCTKSKRCVWLSTMSSLVLPSASAVRSVHPLSKVPSGSLAQA